MYVCMPMSVFVYVSVHVGLCTHLPSIYHVFTPSSSLSLSLSLSLSRSPPQQVGLCTHCPLYITCSYLRPLSLSVSLTLSLSQAARHAEGDVYVERVRSEDLNLIMWQTMAAVLCVCVCVFVCV